jgi:uncharacterized protein (TIGR02145 family)
MKNKSLSLLLTIAILIIAISSAAQETGTFTDSRDGKTYKTVKIGTQTWMAENLAYKAKSGCWALDTLQSNVATYGYLYNWGTSKKVCPAGWHLPSKNEWDTLINYLGGENIAGDKLKEKGGNHWSANGAATNESGFTALAGSYRNGVGRFEYLSHNGYWWSSTQYDQLNAFAMSLNGKVGSAGYSTFNTRFGCSVRCIKDK